MKIKVKRRGPDVFSPRRSKNPPKLWRLLFPNHLAQVPTYLCILFSFQTSTRTRNKNAVFPSQRPCITSLHDLTTIHWWPFNPRRRRMPTIDFQSLRNFQRGGKFPYHYILIILIFFLLSLLLSSALLWWWWWWLLLLLSLLSLNMFFRQYSEGSCTIICWLFCCFLNA